MSHYERALELAERGRGKTGDHPLVGAVVVSDGEVVGEGWYEYERVRHAEVVALEQAGDAARGATLYVTLEPCSHHGRTPPCADAVVAAGVARVVVGARDPNPVVDGRGIERIRAAGIEVELLDDLAARRQNEAWRVVEVARPAVRHVQGGRDARRPRHGARPPLGIGRGVAAPRARAARRVGRGRGRHGDGARGLAAPRRA